MIRGIEKGAAEHSGRLHTMLGCLIFVLELSFIHWFGSFIVDHKECMNPQVFIEVLYVVI